VRLGGPIFEEFTDPEGWISALRRLGYAAAGCPVKADAGDEVIAAYARAAESADIVIAEVGAWSNPLSDDEKTSREAVALCQQQLALADRIGARCCVNIAGGRGPQWDGPDEKNFSDETFQMIVETVREIIDAVRPARTFYTLEPMPWVFPDSPDSYLDLIGAIDRPQFAVHLDPSNMVNSPRRFYGNAALLRECFQKLGPYIKSVHGKDVRMTTEFNTHISEVAPGLGRLDYRVFLREMEQVSPDLPLLTEHLSTPEEYGKAAAYIRSVAKEVGVTIK
jgi:sugar phosphate isomerase/epimerase